jgi:hypothetical protein
MSAAACARKALVPLQETRGGLCEVPLQGRGGRGDRVHDGEGHGKDAQGPGGHDGVWTLDHGSALGVYPCYSRLTVLQQLAKIFYM